MAKADSFVFYRSFFDTAQLLESDSDRLQLYEALIHFGLEGEKPPLPYPLNAILEQMTASVKAASVRYASAKENGQKGGRPKYIPPEEWQAYRAEHTQKETAEHFGVSIDTLQRWEKKTAKPQNLNINDNKNLNVNSNSNSNYLNINNKKEEREPETLKGVPAPSPGMPGYEWVTHGIRYRITENREVETIGPA